ncbi:MAG: CehA/McbA family metallohydrolase [Planctomycetaceae bacterium]|nr:CehA/McbA family metallohydrolase [Planctomycetaceae bacterium]
MKPRIGLCHFVTASLLTCLLAEFTSAAAPAKSTITFHLQDVPSGRPVPAVVCIRSLDDQSVRLPPDGRIMTRFSQTEEFYQGISFDADDPNWIGPRRKMLGKGDNNDRSYVYEQLPSIPFWREPVRYQTQPNFSIQLEPGRYQISVARGMEYIPLAKPFTVTKKDQEHTLRLDRWIDLPARGWFSGDVHVHHPTTQKSHRDFLLRYAEAEDLHVVNLLEMGHHHGTDFKQAGFGKKFREQRGAYWLVSGQEEPRSTFGHIIGLNTSHLARDLDTYDLYDLAFKRIHDQPKALVGFAHFSWNGCNLPRGFPWYVTTEGIDFVELLQFSRINTLDYYDYLNLGFRLAAAAGSDVPWGSSIGEVRTYVHTGEELDIDRWFEGLAKGRTFVSNGPALEFTVNGQLSGSELAFDAPAVVKVQARALGHKKVGLPVMLELVSNDGTIAKVQPAQNESGNLSLNTQIEIKRSQWMAINVRCDNGAVAHTSPIYIVIDGEPTWSPTRGKPIIKKQLEAIASIETEFSGGNDLRSRAILERLARAKGYYAKLLGAIEKPPKE